LQILFIGSIFFCDLCVFCAFALLFGLRLYDLPTARPARQTTARYDAERRMPFKSKPYKRIMNASAAPLLAHQLRAALVHFM